MRISYIDFLKAIAIYLVVLGHIIQNYASNLWTIYDLILSFHMPLFALLSGLFFSCRKKASAFMLSKIKGLVLPLFTWAFLSEIVFRGISDTYLHFSNGLAIHFMGWINCWFMTLFNWGWWFLRALFLSFIFAYFSIRLCRRNVTVGILVSNALLYSLSLLGIIPNRVLNDFIFLYPFFSVGILLREHKNLIAKHQKRIFAYSVFIFVFCLLFWRGYPDCFYGMNTSVFADTDSVGCSGIIVLYKTILRFCIGVSGSCVLIYIAKQLPSIITANKIMSNIGRNTLGIYILHGFVFQLFPSSTKLLFREEVVSLLFAVSVSAIIVLACNTFVNLTDKNRWLRLSLWGRS